MEKKIHVSSVYPCPKIQITTQSFMLAPEWIFPNFAQLIMYQHCCSSSQINILCQTSAGWHSRCKY